jgi:DnaK suppressor protein
VARQKGTSRTRRKKTPGRVGAKSAGAGARKRAGRAGKKTGARSKEKAAGKARSAGKRAVSAEKTVEKVVRIPKKMSAAAKARMAKLRNMLEQRRVEILASIRKAREDTVEAHRQTFSEVGDLVSASVEKEMAFKYGEQGVNMLREIDSALEKLKEGNYGICEACGKNIGVKRLEIVPSARLCIKCKCKEEEGQGNP